VTRVEIPDVYDLMEQVLTDADALERHATHHDWRVRYAAAVAMGESGDPRWLPQLGELLAMEDGRDLYGQPRVLGFTNSFDDTRMAEQLIATEAIFDQEYPEDRMDAWRCRGRVRQAALLAVDAIGTATPELIQLIHDVLEDPDEDFSVKAAGAKALGRVGDALSLPALERALEFDEWCLQVEAHKAIDSLSGTTR
jgi:HEAT repeat protein